jgi:arylsulfatase A-like enzyme
MNIIIIGKNLITIGGLCSLSAASLAQNNRPNILFIMADDHTKQAVSAYQGILSEIMPTPHIDRIAREGALLNNCMVTNSISTPSRAAIITGEYSQKNGVYTLHDALDPKHPNVAKCLTEAGYQTAVFGKWHLHSEPTGFDYYNILPGQGRYNNPILIEKGMWDEDPKVDVGPKNGKIYQGHSTDVITSETIKYLDRRDKEKPFFVMCHFKAPHRNWQPAERFKDLLKDVTVPEPENLLDDYDGKGIYSQIQTLSLEDLTENDLKCAIPDGMTKNEQRKWAYQLYIKDYLRCIAGIDENVGRLLEYLDENNLYENTIVIYTGDQGFFLGEHGWFDKRFMYEEPLHAPFLIRYPKEIKPGTVNNDLILNIDYAPLFLDYANLSCPDFIQGESFRSNLNGNTPSSWRKSMYYRYWMNHSADHNTLAHYGIRTDRYKLIYFYGKALGMSGSKDGEIIPAQWELYDLQQDPSEMHNIYNDPANRKLIKNLKKQLIKLKKEYGDLDDKYPEMEALNKKYFK